MGQINLLAILLIVLQIPLSYVLGLMVERGQLPVYVTRKIVHISFFLSPFICATTVPRVYLDGFSTTFTVAAIVRFLLFFPFLCDRSRFLKISFAAYDRPEDRPYNFELLLLQTAGQLLVTNVTRFLNPELLQPRRYYAIAYLAVALGDGLAEPIGQWIRSPKYRTFSVFSTKGNYRTVAGSACMYLVTLGLVAYFMRGTDDSVAHLIIIPVVAMLLEAFSPKALDNPFIFGGTLMAQHMVYSVALGG